MEEKLPKFNSILVSFIILIAGIFFAIFTLLLTMAPLRSGDFISGSFWAWFFVPIFLIFFIEAIFSRLKKDLAIREENIKYKDGSVWTTFALVLQYIGIIQGIFSMIFLLVLFGFFFYVSPAKNIFTQGFVFSFQFFLLISVYFAYLIIRPIFKRSSLRSSFSNMGKSLSSSVAKNLPKYKIVGDGLVIDLNFKGLGKMKNKKWIIKIDFDEIEEIREMTWVESDAFMTYSVGPNLDLQIRLTKDLYNYTKGKIEKPSVYIATALNQSNKVIFMKGKNLFYLVSFDSTDISDILKAFERYKKKYR